MFRNRRRDPRRREGSRKRSRKQDPFTLTNPRNSRIRRFSSCYTAFIITGKPGYIISKNNGL